MPIIQIYVDDKTHSKFVNDPEKDTFKGKIKEFIVNNYTD